MSKKKMGVLCPSNIAYKRFMPALLKNDMFEFAGIAHANRQEWYGNPEDVSEDTIGNEKKKAQEFIDAYGGSMYDSYAAILNSDIDAIYVPLPPALHFVWGQEVLKHNKHLFLEKPFTTSLHDTTALIELARSKKLAVHENYMFKYHSQLQYINRIVNSDEIGEVRLYRLAFGFPFRGAGDFRYEKSLGGGALLDCGGYTIKLSAMLLGNSAKITDSHLNYKSGFSVDVFGSATMTNEDGLTAQFAFGMDNEYKCELEIWGSNGTIYSNRIFTAPENFTPIITIKTGQTEKTLTLPADDSFRKSIEDFYNCIVNFENRLNNENEIMRQSWLVEEIKKGEPRFE